MNMVVCRYSLMYLAFIGYEDKQKGQNLSADEICFCQIALFSSSNYFYKATEYFD